MAAILIIDDEPNLCRMLARLLEEAGHTVTTAASCAAGVAALHSDAPDVMLLDLALPDGSGLDVLDAARNARPELPVIMISGRATLGDAVQATRRGAFHFIEKPLSPEAVLLTVSSALELSRARELSRSLADELHPAAELIGASEAMSAVRALVAQVGATDARVLIRGESGTGKELVAASLHRASRRAAGPLIRVNSAAIPRELIESEMFGHERGAFSGADERRRGRFELADGGTLFLDEVADLSPSAQAKLLRAIETGEIERVGGEHAIAVDVRILAATNRDLEDAVRSGTFRRDLYYRLNVVEIVLPPLRERRADVPLLLQHFLERQRAAGRPAPQPTSEAVARLCDYTWPGNVRELANLCERMAILHTDRTVAADAIAALLGADGTVADAALSTQLAAHERRLIEHALLEADGNVAAAARRLQTDRANLYRRMRRLGIKT
jgi:two-component system, NtrC family, nitrogen regulation response regulator NtrX